MHACGGRQRSGLAPGLPHAPDQPIGLKKDAKPAREHRRAGRRSRAWTLDPARAEFYSSQGMRVVCPTSTAIDGLEETVRSCIVPVKG